MNDIEFRGRQPNPRRAPVQAAVLKKLLEKRLDSTLTEEYLGHHSYHPKYEIRTDRIGWDLTIVVFFNSFPGLEPSPPGTLEESVVKERAEKIWSDVLPVIWQNGWYVSASRYTDFRCPYAFCAMLNVKPNYTERVEKLPDVLYHVAPTQVASKILLGGLKPYSKSLGFRHPNRVYVSLVSDVSELLDMLSDTQDSQAGYKTIFAVDTSKLRKGTKFYYDEAYELNRRRPPWAWTYSHIPPEALSIVSTWDADDPDLRSNPLAYHGTPTAFTIESAKISAGTYGPGLYFTDSFKEASEYALKRRSDSQNILACQVELQNPLEWHKIYQPDDLTYSEFLSQAYSNGHWIRRVLHEVKESDWSAERGAAAFIAAGYDGIVVQLRQVDVRKTIHVANPALADKTYYVVFDPSKLSCTRREPRMRDFNPIHYFSHSRRRQ